MIKQFISRIIRQRIFFPLWKKLNFLSYYGMNFGVASGYADYSGELYIIKKIKEHKPKIIFDVGAHVGDWSSFLINEYRDLKYTLYMFEPSKKTYDKLARNISASNNKIFQNIGLGDKNEILKIHYDTVEQGNASILADNKKYSEEVCIVTLDSFCVQNAIDNIDFMKMDVQGYEYNVLLGAKNLLAKGRIKFIQFEFDEPNINNRVFFKDFWDLLSEKYDIYQCLYNGIVKIYNYHYELENFRCMNYLAVKKKLQIVL